MKLDHVTAHRICPDCIEGMTGIVPAHHRLVDHNGQPDSERCCWCARYTGADLTRYEDAENVPRHNGSREWEEASGIRRPTPEELGEPDPREVRDQ